MRLTVIANYGDGKNVKPASRLSQFERLDAQPGSFRSVHILLPQNFVIDLFS
jgi:hypothetical protein